MKKEILLTLMMGLFLISITSISALDSLGTFQQNQCINISQTCSTCSYINISSISNKENSNLKSNVEMINVGNGEWRYNFCNTSYLGRYDVKGQGDINSVDTGFATYFEVTPSGFIDTLGLYFIFLIILIAIIVLGFSITEAWFVILGGMGLILLGIYSINYGIVGFRDMFMTWAMGLFEIAVGAILSIGSGIQKIGSD